MTEANRRTVAGSLPLFFRVLIFLPERQVRNIDTLPWKKPQMDHRSGRNPFIFSLRVSAIPWCKGLVFDCGSVAQRLCEAPSWRIFFPDRRSPMPTIKINGADL